VVKEGDSETDGSESVKEEGEGGEGEGGQEEEQQGVLHQVGGHGAHDKAQAMQVSGEGLVLKPIQDVQEG